jgi:hypothetical protein
MWHLFSLGVGWLLGMSSCLLLIFLTFFRIDLLLQFFHLHMPSDSEQVRSNIGNKLKRLKKKYKPPSLEQSRDMNEPSIHGMLQTELFLSISIF